MAKPYSPDEAAQAQLRIIPDTVVEIVNGMLAQRAPSERVVIDQSAVVAALVALGYERHEIFEQNMLDFEGLYREQGWQVVYDKPGFNETYSAHWVFARP